jgi:flagellar basal-body rod protein FlgB
MFINEVLSSGAIPSLEATFRFAAQRQQIINHNIANLETPNFLARDVSPAGFQSALHAAIQKRRGETGGMTGELHFDPTSEIQWADDGSVRLVPRTLSDQILYHDRSNNDEVRLMQANAENAAVYRIASEVLRGRYQQIRDAIGERV